MSPSAGRVRNQLCKIGLNVPNGLPLARLRGRWLLLADLRAVAGACPALWAMEGVGVSLRVGAGIGTGSN